MEIRTWSDYELETLDKIRKEAPELSHISGLDLSLSWESFSDEMYSAGWISCDDDHRINEFIVWLKSKDPIQSPQPIKKLHIDILLDYGGWKIDTAVIAVLDKCIDKINECVEAVNKSLEIK